MSFSSTSLLWIGWHESVKPPIWKWWLHVDYAPAIWKAAKFGSLSLCASSYAPPSLRRLSTDSSHNDTVCVAFGYAAGLAQISTQEAITNHNWNAVIKIILFLIFEMGALLVIVSIY